MSVRGKPPDSLTAAAVRLQSKNRKNTVTTPTASHAINNKRRRYIGSPAGRIAEREPATKNRFHSSNTTIDVYDITNLLFDNKFLQSPRVRDAAVRRLLTSSALDADPVASRAALEGRSTVSVGWMLRESSAVWQGGLRGGRFGTLIYQPRSEVHFQSSYRCGPPTYRTAGFLH